MSRPRLILIGSGGHALSCIDVIEEQGQFEIFGLVNSTGSESNQCLRYPVIGTDNDLAHIFHACQNALIAVGQISSAATRVRLFQRAVQIGFSFPKIIAPTAYVSQNAKVGVGSIVLHGAIINAGSSVGQNCIINSGALIEHGVEVSDHCHISTGSILNGDVIVGAKTFIGSGSVIKEGIVIGSDCLIGMGVSVLENIDHGTQFTGKKL